MKAAIHKVPLFPLLLLVPQEERWFPWWGFHSWRYRTLSASRIPRLRKAMLRCGMWNRRFQPTPPLRVEHPASQPVLLAPVAMGSPWIRETKITNLASSRLHLSASLHRISNSLRAPEYKRGKGQGQFSRISTMDSLNVDGAVAHPQCWILIYCPLISEQVKGTLVKHHRCL